MALTAHDLEEAYNDAAWGAIVPNVILVSEPGYAYLKKMFRTPEEDPFDKWVRELREEKELLDGINGS